MRRGTIVKTLYFYREKGEVCGGNDGRKNLMKMKAVYIFSFAYVLKTAKKDWISEEIQSFFRRLRLLF